MALSAQIGDVVRLTLGQGPALGFLGGWAVFGGIVGAKVYYLALYWPETITDPKAAILSRGGLVW